MKFHHKFLGADEAGQTNEFTSDDNEAMFAENLQIMPKDWYYRNKKIIYSFNEYGHRCKSPKDLDFDNYFLAVGCSHTLGTGLELDKTYIYLLSQHLNCDYYNLAVSGSGLDVAEHNILMWLSECAKLPKFLIFQWPSFIRYCSHNANYDNIMPNGLWNENENNLKFIALADESGLFLARKKLINALLENYRQFPVINIEHNSNAGFLSASLYFKELDRARDNSHPGIKGNKYLFESVAKVLDNYLK